MKTRVQGGRVFACSLAALVQVPIAVAQPDARIEDVIVTARRADETIQTIPVAVTALSAESLQAAQVQTVADLSRTTPNLNISAGGGGPASLVFLSIRGQTQGQPSTSADPAVATYIDGVYYARPTGGDLDLFDVAQAEVLRGPQGTLFGRNTTGGAINVITNDPTGNYEGLVRGGIGNLGKRQFEAMVNAPINGDELAARAVLRYTADDGYSRIVRLNNRDAGDVESNYSGRVKLRWAPAEKPVTAVLAVDYSKFESSGQATTTLGFNPNLDLGGGFTTGMALGLVGFDPAPYLSNKSNFYKNYGYADTGFGLDVPHDNNESKGASLNVDVELGDIALKSITALRKNTTDNVLDLDGLPINLVSFRSDYDQHQFSEELQLSGSLGDLEWIGGAMYFREASEELADSRAFSFLDPSTPLSRGTSGDTENTSAGVFGQVNYHLTDDLRVTAGYRYTWDRREIVRHPKLNLATDTCAIPAGDRDVPGGACNQTQIEHFHYPAWVLSLDYQLRHDVLVYAKTSGAAMAGGWNLRGNFAPAFSPEKVRDVEAGIKADMLDQRLRTNLAVFHTWQKDAQRVVADFDPQFNTSTQYVVNSGDVRLYGAELEATLLPWEGMTLKASYAYLHAEYEKGTFTEQQTIASAGPVPAGCVAGSAGTIVCAADRSGEPIPFAPKYNWSLAATQEFHTPVGELSAHVDYVYTASRRAYVATAADQQSQSYKDQVATANELGVIDSYGLLNALLTLTIDEHWEASVWGRNLTDKRYSQNIADYYLAFGAVLGAVAPPRTYGATVAYRW